MASRENQGLHIALILFVMITVALAVTTYFGFSGSAESSEKLKNKEVELTEERKLSEVYQIQAELLKYFIGEKTDIESPELVQSQLDHLKKLETGIDPDQKIFKETVGIADLYNQDMLLVSGEETEKNWRTMFESLKTAMAQKNSEIEDLANQVKRAEAERDQGIAAEVAKTTQAETARDDLQKELQNLQSQFAATQKQMQEQATKNQETLRLANLQVTKVRSESSEVIKQRDDEIVNLKNTVAEKQAMIQEYDEESFEIADGKITDVVASSGIVYINVGFKDNLPRLATFGVYGQEYDVFNKSVKKADIEVKRILGAHIAEARITGDSLSDPVLPGDFINSSSWAPGRQLTFGITGRIDIDGDGNSINDSERLKNIIERNGGKVVAHINQSGDIVGELTPRTRYLITGDDPNDKTANANTTLYNQADSMGVEKMYYRDFLDGMGYRGEATTQRLGSAGDEGFQSRRPPKRGESGAY